ncbi:MAG: hypothetical protein ABSG18_26850, partial [Steroidobacteraceae bacterium]
MNQPESFELLAEWFPKPEKRMIDSAKISLRANGHVFTRLADVQSSETRDFIRASAVSLALWICDNWWRIRYEPFPPVIIPSTDWRLRHEMTSISGGTTWPPLMIYGEGARVVIAPRLGITDVPGPVRYLNSPVVSLGASTYEAGVDEFLNCVIANCAEALDGATLSANASDLSLERLNPETAAWRRMEARLGYDPDFAPDGLLLGLQKLQEQFGEDAVSEGVMSAPGPDAMTTIRKELEAISASDIVVDLSAAKDLPSAGERPTSSTPPWRLAEKAAKELREKVGITKGPIRWRPLSDILGASKESLHNATATARLLPYAAQGSLNGSSSKAKIAVKRSERQRRFELARSLGDATWQGLEPFAPLSSAKTDRQKFQRAFAQSLLCPFDELISYINTSSPTAEDITAAADYFHVSEPVVRTVLVNKEIIPRERLEDRLDRS